jgi:hypothetical protein
MRALLLTFSLLTIVSCQTPWDRYDESLYTAVFDPSEESLARHIQTLEGFTNSESPPPGLCAELAYYLALAGRNAEAEAWLDRELALWPESSKVVSALRSLITSNPEPSSEDGEEAPQ